MTDKGTDVTNTEYAQEYGPNWEAALKLIRSVETCGPNRDPDASLELLDTIMVERPGEWDAARQIMFKSRYMPQMENVWAEIHTAAGLNDRMAFGLGFEFMVMPAACAVVLRGLDPAFTDTAYDLVVSPAVAAGFTVE